jgi:hypothetical protein
MLLGHNRPAPYLLGSRGAAGSLALQLWPTMDTRAQPSILGRFAPGLCSKEVLRNRLEFRARRAAHVVPLHMMYYNFVCIHSKLRVTPAMAAGVADRLWEVPDIVSAKTEAKRGPYKKREVN